MTTSFKCLTQSPFDFRGGSNTSDIITFSPRKRKHFLTVRCNLSSSAKPEPKPVFTSVKTFAPATVANLGPGFDILGCAVDGLEVMKMLGIRSAGLSLSLQKGLPLGSGLGSSAASAAAAAVAVNEIFGSRLGVDDLVLASLKSEEKDLYFVLVTPEFEAPTQKMRAVLPSDIGMPHHNWNSSHACALVASVLQGDSVGLGRALSSDKIVEPRRAPSIPGMEAVKKAAIEAGAFGCTISAAAVIDEEAEG